MELNFIYNKKNCLTCPKKNKCTTKNENYVIHFLAMGVLFQTIFLQEFGDLELHNISN